MAGRKKSPGAAEFTVVLEDLRAQFKVFGEALAGVREEFGQRFDAVEGRLGSVEGELALVKVAVLENRREIRDVRAEIHDVRTDLHDVRGTVTRIEHALETKVDRDEVEGIVARVLAR
jgi:hypothetical protein